jgi:ABC-type phosphate transport system permease subunit
LRQGERFFAGSLVIGLFALSLLPLTFESGEDSFPFSSYPMFSRPRRQAETVQALALDEKRRAHVLPPSVVGSEEAMQAAATLRRAAAGGGRRAKTLCRHIARRVAADGNLTGAIAVEIARISYDPVRYLTAGPTPGRRRRVVRCKVPR